MSLFLSVAGALDSFDSILKMSASFYILDFNSFPQNSSRDYNIIYVRKSFEEKSLFNSLIKT